MQIMELFKKVEPRLELKGTEGTDLTFELTDCDGFSQGFMIAKSVSMVCMPTVGVSFGEIQIFRGDEISKKFNWLEGYLDEDMILATFVQGWDMEEDMLPLPLVDGNRLAFILAADFLYESS